MSRRVFERRRSAWSVRSASVVVAIVTLVGGLFTSAVAAPPSLAAQSTAAHVAASGIRPATLAGFSPGNIISDAVFFNSGSMNESQIQSFLNGKVPSCQSGYVCLKDFRQSTYTRPASLMCPGAYTGEANEPASRIVAKVAQACGINPQVLLTTLQKEQGLVTHTWPSDWRYTIAMGQGCPDTAACDAKYYGFFNQVYGAASQFKRYANPPGTSQYFTWYAPGKTWNVRYHPNVTCGSSPVLIQNQATANLYYYTPYQPNGAALAAGFRGANDPCSSYGNRNFYNYFTDWFGSTQGNPNPFGALDVVQAEPGVFRVVGWAADPDTPDHIAVHVYVGAAGRAITADLDRPDVGAAFPSVGSRHGFDARVVAAGSGSVNVCAFGINAGPGTNSVLGCRTLTAMSGAPIGNVDVLRGIDGGVQITGWAFDPDTTASIPVHVYVDSSGTPMTADGNRPDVAGVFPAYGAPHGFSASLPAAPGVHNVCAYAINTGPGDTAVLGCQQVTVPAGTNNPPIGSYDGISVKGLTAIVSGWAIDPDTVSAINVRVAVGRTSQETVADGFRPDVGRVHPTSGPNHGFTSQISVPVGTSSVCVSGVDSTTGVGTSFGCRTITATQPPGHAPIGSYDFAKATTGGATIAGWAIDPDTSAPIYLSIVVDGVSTTHLANGSRPDVASVFTGYGDLHGFSPFIAMPPGVHQVCVIALDSAGGQGLELGCRTVTLP